MKDNKCFEVDVQRFNDVKDSTSIGNLISHQSAYFPRRFAKLSGIGILPGVVSKLMN